MADNMSDNDLHEKTVVPKSVNADEALARMIAATSMLSKVMASKSGTPWRMSSFIDLNQIISDVGLEDDESRCEAIYARVYELIRGGN